MFAKLFNRITESSLMEESIETRYVFVMLLAVSDLKGYVVGTDVALARRLNIPVDVFKAAVERLLAPDPNSNNPANDGRRIVPSDGDRGYQIVNYLQYRNTRDAEHRREYMRNLMADKRGGKSVSNVSSVSNPLAPVSSVSTGKPPLAHTEAEAEAEAETKKKNKGRGSVEEVKTFCLEVGLTESDADWFFNKCEGCGWTNGGNPIKDWKATIRAWKQKGNIFPSQSGQTTQGQKPLPMFLQIKNLEEQIARHPANYESKAFTGKPTEEQLAEYKSLLAKLKELKTTPND